MPLNFAPCGKETVITKVSADDDTRRHLENLGLIAGAKVTPLSGEGNNVIIRVLGSRLALDGRTATKIFVR